MLPEQYNHYSEGERKGIKKWNKNTFHQNSIGMSENTIIRSSMPQTSPSSLSRHLIWDVVASTRTQKNIFFWKKSKKIFCQIKKKRKAKEDKWFVSEPQKSVKRCIDWKITRSQWYYLFLITPFSLLSSSVFPSSPSVLLPAWCALDS